MQRIAVIGVSGAGKTTLSGQVARRLGVPHVEMDALHFEANWREVPLPVFRERVATAAAGERWVMDGTYGKTRDLVWSRADHVVWLDYPLWRVLSRLGRRTLRRVLTREVLWAGNRETLSAQLLSRESLFLWAWQSHPRYRRTFPAILASAPYQHLAVTRLRSPKETAAWLASLASAPP